MLCLNVSAGIGVLGMASPMIQEIFKGRVTASAAAGFAGLLSLFNIAGRIFWASLSDRIGRKATYTRLLRARHAALRARCRPPARRGSLALFVAHLLRDPRRCTAAGSRRFPRISPISSASAYVGAIHGRLLTAWSTAGILGPVLVNYIREFQIARGVAPADAYTFTMYMLVGSARDRLRLQPGDILPCPIGSLPKRRSLIRRRSSRRHWPPAPAVAQSAVANLPMVVAPAAWAMVNMAWTLVGLPLILGRFSSTLALARRMM